MSSAGASDALLCCPNQDPIEISGATSVIFADGPSKEDSKLPVSGLDSYSQNEYQQMNSCFTETLNQFRSHSLPMYFSKRCKVCNKPQLYAKTHLPHFTWTENNVTDNVVTCRCLTQRSTAIDDRSCPHPLPNTHYAQEISNKHIDTVPLEDGESRHSYLRDKVDPPNFKRKRQVHQKK